MQSDSYVSQILDSKDGSEHILGILIQHQDFPHGRPRRGRYLKSWRASTFGTRRCFCWIYRVVEVKQ